MTKEQVAKKMIANKIIVAIEEKRWKRIHIAEDMGIDPGLLSRWTSGKHNFTVSTLVRIEDYFKIKLLNLNTNQ